MRRKYEKITQLKSGNILLHTVSVRGQRGVGFLVKNSWKDQILEFKVISERIVVFKDSKK